VPSRASSSPRRARGDRRPGVSRSMERRCARRRRGPREEEVEASGPCGGASSRKRVISKAAMPRPRHAPASCVVLPLNRVALNRVVGGKCHSALAEASCRQQRARLSVSRRACRLKSEEERSAARPNQHVKLGGEEAGRRPCCSRRCVRSVVFRRCTRRHALGGTEVSSSFPLPACNDGLDSLLSSFDCICASALHLRT